MAAREEGGVLLCDADVEIALWNLCFKGLQFCSAGHCGGDCRDCLIFFCEVGDSAAEEFGKGGSSRCGGSIFDVVRPETVKFPRLIESRLIAATFFGDDMKNDRLVLLLEMFEAFDQRREIVTVDRSIVAHTEFLKENVGHDHVFGIALNLLGKFSGARSGHFFNK